VADGILVKHAAELARAFVQAVRDMRGVEYRMDGRGRQVRQSGAPFPMIVTIRFSGNLEGEYALSLARETAAQLAGCWSPKDGAAALAATRDEYESFVKEALNTAVGGAIVALEAPGGFAFDTASVAYEPAGRDAARGEMLVLGVPGPVACSFLLDARGGRKAD
jgi:CheY-specific phosphatase CheX